MKLVALRDARTGKIHFSARGVVGGRTVEFGLSLGTAKNVLRDLRAKAGNPNRYRPRIDAERAGFIHGTLSKPANDAFGEEIGVKGFKAPAVVIPRDPTIRAGRVAPAGTGDALMTSLHEHGHGADNLALRYVNARKSVAQNWARPPSLQDGPGPGAVSVVAKFERPKLALEKRANNYVLAAVKKHGSPDEVAQWKKHANNQMRVGYRNPTFKVLMRVSGAQSLTQKKHLLLNGASFLRSRVANLAASFSCASLGSRRGSFIDFARGDQALSYAGRKGWFTPYLGMDHHSAGQVAGNVERSVRDAANFLGLARNRAAGAAGNGWTRDTLAKTIRRNRFESSPRYGEYVAKKKASERLGIVAVRTV